MDFIIYSLPRSGSAWLANLLSYDDVFCYHEPLADGTVHKARPAAVTGCVDTAAYRFPVTAPRQFALIRDPQQIRHSLSKLNDVLYDDDIEAFELRVRGMPRIQYDQLHSLPYLAKIWCHFSIRPFNFHRAEQLIEMRVERDFDALVRRVGRAYGAELPKLD